MAPVCAIGSALTCFGSTTGTIDAPPGTVRGARSLGPWLAVSTSVETWVYETTPALGIVGRFPITGALGLSNGTLRGVTSGTLTTWPLIRGHRRARGDLQRREQCQCRRPHACDDDRQR